MIRLQDIKTPTLVCANPYMFGRDYELKGGEDLVATLEFKKAFSAQADVISADGKWTFSYKGIFNTSVHVTDADSGAELAVLSRRDGILEFTGGRRFRWVKADFWATKWAFNTDDGGRFMIFIPAGGLKNFLKSALNIELSPAAINMREATLLAMLGSYVMLLIRNEQAAAAGAASGVG